MGRHETTHRIKPGILVPLKESIIKDKETGEKGIGHSWYPEGSYEKADRKAWEDLQRQNEEDEED
jgi:hypothetical protein